MIRLWKPVAVAISVITLDMTLLTTGCGSGSTQVRLLNAIDGQSSVNMLVNNTTVASGIVFGAASAYLPVGSGSQQVEIKNGGTTLVNQTENIIGGNNNTVLATGSGLTVFTDNKTTPSSGNIQIRAINASVSINPADVYVVSSTNPDISSVNPTWASVGFQTATPYQTMPAGGYEVIYAFSGQKIPIISMTQSFSAGEIRSAVSFDYPSPSGTFLPDLN